MLGEGGMEKLRRRRSELLPDDLKLRPSLQMTEIRGEIATACGVRFESVGRWVRDGRVERKHLQAFLGVLRRFDEGASAIIDRTFGRPAIEYVLHPENQFDAALTQLSKRPIEGVGVMSMAFRAMAASSKTEAVLDRVPRLLYALLRHSTPMHLLTVVQETVQPFLKTLQANTRMEPGARTATLATLACAINENGGFREAMDIFARTSSNLPDPTDRSFGWSTLMALRSEANGGAWKRDERAARRAVDRASEDRSATNLISMTNTCTEINLAFDRPLKAWEGIAPMYEEVYRILSESYDIRTGLLRPGKTPLSRPHHQYALLVNAILAAAACESCPLSPSTMDQSIAFATALGHQQLGRRTPVDVAGVELTPATKARLVDIERKTLHVNLNRQQRQLLVDCATLVQNLRS